MVHFLDHRQGREQHQHDNDSDTHAADTADNDNDQLNCQQSIVNPPSLLFVPLFSVCFCLSAYLTSNGRMIHRHKQKHWDTEPQHTHRQAREKETQHMY